VRTAEEGKTKKIVGVMRKHNQSQQSEPNEKAGGDT
jgi:hypothetical protein